MEGVRVGGGGGFEVCDLTELIESIADEEGSASTLVVCVGFSKEDRPCPVEVRRVGGGGGAFASADRAELVKPSSGRAGSLAELLRDSSGLDVRS